VIAFVAYLTTGIFVAYLTTGIFVYANFYLKVCVFKNKFGSAAYISSINF